MSLQGDAHPPGADGAFENHILRRLPPDEIERLRPEIEILHVPPRHILQEIDERHGRVFFPDSGMLSIVIVSESGQAIEVAAVGMEGVVGPLAIGGGPISFLRLIGQVDGETWAMEEDSFNFLRPACPVLDAAYAAYSSYLFAVAAQSAICGLQHQIPARLVRWLLTVSDCVGSDRFTLTQEFMAEMLGVGRPSVSIAAHTLAKSGIITFSRGRVEILDRQAMEESACPCYAMLRQRRDLLMG